MAAIDIDKLMQDILSAVDAATGKNIEKMGGYAQSKLKAIAQQSQMVASAYASGQIDKDVMQHFLDGIQDMTTSFIQTLVGLARIEAEKAWNAMVGVIWDALGAATGGALKLVKPGL